SQDATIVVGTAIDMEMADELRVTVVAAGLDGRKEKAVTRESAARPETTDYRKLQQPTVMRQQAAKADQDNAAKTRQEKRKSQELDDYLDIPAFLRRQAD
ncbi:cell division protein FtsZ, partial [Halomonas sp. BBD48]|nr:cell division protein FtsZ [Halomonas sp. BBD48]